jgi:hypothetical protein
MNGKTNPDAAARSNAPAKFDRASVVRHIKSAGLYVIVLGPHLVKIEATAQPAYAYRALQNDGTPTGALWVRSQAEMEDGRFELVSEHNPEKPGPSLDSLLAPSMSRYEAEVVTPDHMGSPARWDCTQHLTTHYSLSEFWEIVSDPAGSLLADGLRKDPQAPAWVKELKGPVAIRVQSISG